MEAIKNKLPTIKIPKLKKFREWNAETITGNITQFVNRYMPKAIDSKKQTEATEEAVEDNALSHYGGGISTISGGIPERPKSRDKSKDNYGLYALKSDRNAAKKGVLLSIPLKKKTKKHKRSGSTAEAVHEKFQSCEKTDDGSDCDDDCDYEEEVLEIEVDDFEEEEPPPPPPPVPPRRKAPVVPIQKNKSELHRIINKKPETRDIFVKKEERDVFREFDQIFTNDPPSLDSIPPIPDSFTKQKLQSTNSSFSSSIEESYEEVKRKAMRRTSIQIQNFNPEIQRCKSIIPSPKHCEDGDDKPPVRAAPPKPQSILKKPTPPVKPPPTTKSNEIRTVAAKIPPSPPKKPMLKVSPKPTKRFFVYYNDENDLVFNKSYNNLQQSGLQSSAINNDKFLLQHNLQTSRQQQQQQQQQNLTNFTHFNNADALFKHYYLDHDSLRSAVSTDGIFI